MIVRARVKTAEYLPGWAKCCEGQLDSLAAIGDMTLDLSDTRNYPSIFCKICGYTHMPKGGVRTALTVDGTQKGLYAPLEVLDIDEGQIEPEPVTTAERIGG